jgi:hypothetical protein
MRLVYHSPLVRKAFLCDPDGWTAERMDRSKKADSLAGIGLG